MCRHELLDNSTRNWSAYGGAWRLQSVPQEDHGTTHFSVVDAHRMAVSMTTTINRGFGSYVYSNSTGVRRDPLL